MVCMCFSTGRKRQAIVWDPSSAPRVKVEPEGKPQASKAETGGKSKAEDRSESSKARTEDRSKSSRWAAISFLWVRCSQGD